jgi:pyruvate/2-oxoglutarate dehydrogenase complex dihydrolipoamide acyltransferase (E2) component
MPRPKRHELRLPDLGLRNQAARLSVWLVEDGSEVTEGDRLVEILLGNATVDLPAPASGILRHSSVAEDDVLVVGQLLGEIEEVASE